MGEPALRLTSHAPEPTPAGCRPYLNHVPAWAMRAPAVIAPPKGAKLRGATAQNLLRAMADSGDVDDAGNITNILGGKTLATAAAMGERTVDRYITHLVNAGVVVVLSRGGVVPTGRWGKQQSVANVYGIPVAAGSLDHRKVKRREQAMKPTDELDRTGRTKYVVDVAAPGDQTTLWPSKRARPAEAGYAEPGTHRIGPTQQRTDPQAEAPSTRQQTDVESSSAQASRSGKADTIGCKPQLPDRQSDAQSAGLPDADQPQGVRVEKPQNPTINPRRGAGVAPPGRGGSAPGALLPSPRPSPVGGLDNNHRARSSAPPPGSVVIREASGRGGSKAAGKSRPRGKPKVNDAAGRSIEPADLSDLNRLMPIHARCVELGILADCPIDRLRFVSAAVSALKVTDENKAGNPCAVFANNVNKGRWLFITEGDEQTAQRLLVDYDRAQDRASRPPDPPKAPRPPLSHDAQLLSAAYQLARTDKLAREPFAILRETKAWSRERFDRAKAELDNRPWS